MSRSEGLVDYSDSGSDNSASPQQPEKKRARVSSWDAVEEAANEDDVKKSSSLTTSSSSNVRSRIESKKLPMSKLRKLSKLTLIQQNQQVENSRLFLDAMFQFVLKLQSRRKSKTTFNPHCLRQL